MDLYKIIGKNLKLYRDNLGLTQENVAEYLGIKREILSYYENEQRSPSIDILNKLTDLYGVEIKDLFDDNPELAMLNSTLEFRDDNLKEKDLETIAKFRKIVKNYLKMIIIENKNE